MRPIFRAFRDVEWMWRFWIVVVAIGGLAFVVFVATGARADWDGATSPEIREWFRQQRNARGDVCCDDTEVARVDDYQWRDGGFDVVVDGATYRAAPDKLSRDANKLGPALVWFYPRNAERSDATLRCFMRGLEG